MAINEGVILEAEADYFQRIVALLVTATLKRVGSFKDDMSKNECEKTWGTSFRHLVEIGAVHPRIKGNTHVYSRERIEALLAVQSLKGKLNLEKINKTLSKNEQ